MDEITVKTKFLLMVAALSLAGCASNPVNDCDEYSTSPTHRVSGSQSGDPTMYEGYVDNSVYGCKTSSGKCSEVYVGYGHPAIDPRFETLYERYGNLTTLYVNQNAWTDSDGYKNERITQSNLVDTIYFEHDSSMLSSKARHDLVQHVRYLLANPKVRVELVGQASLPGTKEYNQRLSLRRAKVVRDFMVFEGADPARISTRGIGESQSVSDSLYRVVRINYFGA
ncbi:OmpA family protein [Photobacterium sp. ZSDE20]|uniref:OmpA family protein n=1 Tax=Photobacterium pectinilyticum TaxID=2906793 RepID=A0ABT1N103_9GAMM|nr:OmpA family protein [Photobacterium sp. ZSDE20]MCQ1058411.1 OmpA family protein [Photobacterium sp. ZSDE20]MDD1825226.1 OmpA family protein [Photobacterium sp. ZSDE20]